VLISIAHDEFLPHIKTYLAQGADHMNHRLKTGDRVRVTGILAQFYTGRTGIVVAVEPNTDGIRELDRYIIEIQGLQMGDTKFADFQLALTSNEGG
jgi:hypothetical protein